MSQVLRLVHFFIPLGPKKAMLSQYVNACVLALAHVYYYRLGDQGARHSYWDYLQDTLIAAKVPGLKSLPDKPVKGRDYRKSPGFSILLEPGAFQKIVTHGQNRITKHMTVDETIAMNEVCSCSHNHC